MRNRVRLNALVQAGALALLTGFISPALAADHAIALKGGKLVIRQEQQWMLEASKRVIEGDYPAALQLYNQVISSDGGNIQAYVQRGVVRRQMQDENGCQQDATMAVRLSDAAIQQDPNNSKLYYQRGTGYRLLKDFPQARENIEYAIRLSGKARADWETDLKAIALEEKMMQ